jgi:propane monooxygenase coupling protein
MPGAQISYYPALIRIDGVGRLEFDMNEISERLGSEFAPHQFQVEMSTHYGRMVLLDDKLILFADPGEAAQYLAEGVWLPAAQQAR